MDTQILNDNIDRCLRGDLSAYRTIVEEYQGYAYALAFRCLCHEEDAKDIVQDAFIRVWNNLGKYNAKIKFSTWLYTIVTNLCYDVLRSRNRKRTILMNEADIALIASTEINENPMKLLSNNELASIIETLTDALPPKQRIIFILRDVHGLHIREVCEILHLSQSSVKTNLVYARKTLRQKIEPFLLS